MDARAATRHRRAPCSLRILRPAMCDRPKWQRLQRVGSRGHPGVADCSLFSRQRRHAQVCLARWPRTRAACAPRPGSRAASSCRRAASLAASGTSPLVTVRHARAVTTLLEALSLWLNQRLCVALSAASLDDGFRFAVVTRQGKAVLALAERSTRVTTATGRETASRPQVRGAAARRPGEWRAGLEWCDVLHMGSG
jgi:D-serine deaminase-like pyridoxal phosphate-dependent protein